MTRKISIAVDGFHEAVVATLDDEGQPEFADRLWKELSEPVRMWTEQASSTGDWITGRGRPSTQALPAGTQAAPLSEAQRMCDIEAGAVVYAGFRALGFGYGPDVTEPLFTRGPVVAWADDRSLFYRAGRHVCDSHFRTHRLVPLTVSRVED